MTHLYIPEQYFEAFAKPTSSSRITGRYVVKHFVEKRFGQKRCSVLTVWDHTEESSQALTSQPHWLRFFLFHHSNTVPFGSATIVCPNLSGNPPHAFTLVQHRLSISDWSSYSCPSGSLSATYLHNAADIEIVSDSFALYIWIVRTFGKSW